MKHMSAGKRIGIYTIGIIVFVMLSIFWLSVFFEFKLELLWTDRLIFLLVIIITVFVIYTRQHEHLSAPWRSVFHRRLAMISLVILLLYVVTGLLDSIHFRLPLETQGEQAETVQYSPEVLSVLDHLLAPLRTRTEKTYSAPFAVYSFSKETIEMPDGSVKRDFLRLLHGGKHLRDPVNDRLPDIISKSITGLIAGLIAWGFIVLIAIIWLAHKAKVTPGNMAGRIVRGKTDVPWHIILATLGIIFVLTALALNLGTHYHIFGTDKVGQDVFYLTLKSVRTGLVIGTLTTMVMLPFAILLGIMAGYLKGWVDDAIQYIYTTLNSIPGVLLIAALILILQAYMNTHPELFSDITTRADARLLILCLILGLTSWTGLCRLLRGEALKLREADYIQAATAFGVGHFTIITRHILPNVMHIVLISVVLDFSGLVLAEAVLAYVGVGVDPSMNSWGNMINSARLELARDPVVWWSLIAAFVFMFTLVLAANLFSDAVRDAFDPRLRQR